MDFVFPPAGNPGSNDEYTVYVQSAGGQELESSTRRADAAATRVRIAIPANVRDSLTFSSDSIRIRPGWTVWSIAWPRHAGPSNQVLITAATARLYAEQADNESPEKQGADVAPAKWSGSSSRSGTWTGTAGESE